jgi:long-chain-fatty-acid--CoA ligase ACSBG
MIGCIGAMFAGGKASGVYPSDTHEQFQYKCHHSRSSIVLVESLEHVKVISKVIGDLPYLKAIAVWGATPKEDVLGHVKIFSWAQFMAKADGVSDAELENRMQQIKPGHPCSLIYTSGTSKFDKNILREK